MLIISKTKQNTKKAGHGEAGWSPVIEIFEYKVRSICNINFYSVGMLQLLSKGMT